MRVKNVESRWRRGRDAATESFRDVGHFFWLSKERQTEREKEGSRIVGPSTQLQSAKSAAAGLSVLLLKDWKRLLI